jgi:hypothetical protein
MSEVLTDSIMYDRMCIISSCLINFRMYLLVAPQSMLVSAVEHRDVEFFLNIFLNSSGLHQLQAMQS